MFCILVLLYTTQISREVVPPNLPVCLKAIAFVESSDGNNQNHKCLRNGQRAFGHFGMFGFLIREIIQRNPFTFRDVLQLSRLPDERLYKEIKKRQGLEERLAIMHLKHLDRVFRHNSNLVFLAWNQGQVGAQLYAKKYPPETHPYVIKANKALAKILKRQGKVPFVTHKKH